MMKRTFQKGAAFFVALVMLFSGIPLAAAEGAATLSGNNHLLIGGGSFLNHAHNTAGNGTATFDGNLRNVRFVAEHWFGDIGSNPTWGSIFLELEAPTGTSLSANMQVVGAMFRSTGGGTSTRNADSLGVGAGSRAAVTGTAQELAAATGGLNIQNPTRTQANATVFVIDVEITSTGALTWRVDVGRNNPQGEFVSSGTATVGTATVPAGTRVASGNVTRTGTATTNTIWRVYDTTVPTEPDPVTEFGAQALADGRVELSWNTVDGADEYRIVVDDGAPVYVDAGGGASQSHTIASGLVNGQRVDFRIYAGFRGVFNATAATAHATPDLAAVTTLRVTPVQGGVSLVWDNVDGANGFIIERAAVTGGEPGDFAPVSEFANPGGTTVTRSDAGLAPNPYAWRVIAENFAGFSNHTANVVQATPQELPPEPPANPPADLDVQTGVSRRAELEWEPVDRAEFYGVYFRIAGDGTWTAISPNANDNNRSNVGNRLTYTITGLDNGREYEFGVTAGNRYGWATGMTVETALVHSETLNPRNVEAFTWFENIHAYWRARPEELLQERPFEVYVRPTGSVEWTRHVNDPAQPIAGMTGRYNDHSPLVRQVRREVSAGVFEDDWWRVDVVGLVGNEHYDIKVVATYDDEENVIIGLAPPPFDRQGFAFHSRSPFGRTTGGYNADGTAPDNAVVVYVTNENRNSFETPFGTTGGLQGLFPAPQGRAANRANDGVRLGEATPLIVRVIGRVERHTAVRPGGDYETMNIRNTANVTVEGIGTNATLHAWGLYVRNSSNIEIRNLTFTGIGSNPGSGGTDAIFLQGGSHLDQSGGGHRPIMVNPNSSGADVPQNMPANAWIHHNTFPADTSERDGAIDAARYNYFTIANNHIIGQPGNSNIRGTLLGNNNSNPTFSASLHGNWYEGINQRLPLLRFGQMHIYNNFFQHGSQSGGSSIREGAFAVIEGNNYHLPLWGITRQEGQSSSAIIHLTRGTEQINTLADALEENIFTLRPGDTFERRVNHGVGGTFSLSRFFDPRSSEMESLNATVFAASEVERIVTRNSGVMKNQQLYPLYVPDPPVLREEPRVPANVRVEIGEGEHFVVSWAADFLAASFEVEMDDSVIAYGITTNSFTTTQQAQLGATAVFRVRAIADDGTPTAWSQAVSVTFAPPQMPEGLAVTAIRGGLQISWNAPEVAPASYWVVVTREGEQYPVWQGSVTDTSLTVNNLPNGIYTVAVRSVVGNQHSEPVTDSATITTQRLAFGNTPWDFERGGEVLTGDAGTPWINERLPAGVTVAHGSINNGWRVREDGWIDVHSTEATPNSSATMTFSAELVESLDTIRMHVQCGRTAVGERVTLAFLQEHWGNFVVGPQVVPSTSFYIELDVSGRSDSLTLNWPRSAEAGARSNLRLSHIDVVYSVEAARVNVGNVTGEPGQTVTVPVTITDNPGVANYRFTVEYDGDLLEFYDYCTEDAVIPHIGVVTFMETGTFTVMVDVDDDAFGNVSDDGLLVNLQFIVKTANQAVTTPVTLTNVLFENADDELVEHVVTYGAVTIAVPAVTAIGANPVSIAHNAASRDSVITVTGTHLDVAAAEQIRVGAFLAGEEAPEYEPELTAGGTAASRTATLTFGEVPASDRVYTIRVSMDGGTTWLTAPSATVTVLAEVLPNLVSVTNPAPVNGTRAQAMDDEWNLPDTVAIVVNPANPQATANVEWDTDGINFDAAILTPQSITVSGVVELPSGVTNTAEVELTASITVNVPAANLGLVDWPMGSINRTRAQAEAAVTIADWNLWQTVSLFELIPDPERGQGVYRPVLIAEVPIVWTATAYVFDPLITEAQTVRFNGEVTLPYGVTNTDNRLLTTTAFVNVGALIEETGLVRFSVGGGEGGIAAVAFPNHTFSFNDIDFDDFIDYGAELPIGTMVAFIAAPEEEFVVESWSVNGVVQDDEYSMLLTEVVEAEGLNVVVTFAATEEDELEPEDPLELARLAALYWLDNLVPVWETVDHDIWDGIADAVQTYGVWPAWTGNTITSREPSLFGADGYIKGRLALLHLSTELGMRRVIIDIDVILLRAHDTLDEYINEIGIFEEVISVAGDDRIFVRADMSGSPTLEQLRGLFPTGGRGVPGTDGEEDIITIPYGLPEDDDGILIGTGFRVMIPAGEGLEAQEVVIVVENDLNGDGEAGHEDVMLMAGHIVNELNELEPEQMAAAGVTATSSTPSLLNALIRLARAGLPQS